MTRDIFLLLLLGISVPLSLSGQDAKYAGNSDYLSYVNILQGTDSNRGLSHGNTLPLVGMPWGMTDWAIQSEDKGAWFFKPNGKLAGFRATHEPSPWMGDYGHFILMPQSGDLKMDFPSRISDYDTTTSLLRPDYERLDLKKDQILAELTATERCAVFRLTFHQGNTGRLILNTFGDTDFQIQSRTIRGITTDNSGGVPKDFALYFVIELNRDIVKSETFKHAFTTDPAKVDGVAGYVEFNTAPADPVEVRVGTSFIGYDQAEQNLKAETTGGFDAVRARVRDTWEHNLGRVEVEANEDQKKTFYSCLYRAQMFPHRLYELDSTGKAVHFSPYDDKVHPGVLYGDTGIWDAFRTTFPLIAILYPAPLQEILQGFVNASLEGGTLPEWPCPGYRSGMIGQHCAAIFSDAVAKGLTNFDVAAAYASLKRSAFQPPTGHELVRVGLADYLKFDYIPDGKTKYAVSTTLDYAYDDWCVAQIAKQQGDLDTYNALMARAQNYRNLWDPGVSFMRPKNEAGEWIAPFDPFAWGGSYAESGPWQSSWFVPHDPAGLEDLIGGPNKLAAKMDEMLATPPIFHVGGYKHVIHEMSEMASAHFGQYAQSNQPSFNNLYFFTVAGQPWKTEYWTRRVCAEMYDSSSQGFPGDEDTGSMASWYILNSIGLYSFCPGTPTYLLTSPIFTRVTLHLPQDKTFTVNAPANNEKNVYVEKRQLNGPDITRTWITYDEIMRGGTLDLQMGSDPNIRTVQDQDLPYSETPYK